MEETRTDPVTLAAETLLGVPYLYPWQRLVVANILEAAVASGMAVNWPGGEAAAQATLAAGIETELPAPDGGDELPAAPLREAGEAQGISTVILPTGAGKSLCFQLPALLLDRPTLVLYPILSLMADQFRRLEERGFKPVILRGGQSADERAAIWNAIERGEARFIIANPEVLLTEGVMGRLGTLGIGHIVLDEAHCVSEWGESFRPSYLRVAEILEATGAPLATAFTATASPEVLDKIDRYVFGGRASHRIIGNPDRPNIRYATVGCIVRDIAVRDLLVRMPRPAIVFCSSRSGTERLARFLRAELGTDEVFFYHAGLEREEKSAVESWFFGSRDGILTATCAYGMGVDKADIRTVIHRDIPPTVEAYLQESGRAGRDGTNAEAVLLWGPEDTIRLDLVEKEADRSRFAALLAWARDAGTCRREGLLGLMGATMEHCEGCDVCSGAARGELREKRSAIDFIRRNPRSLTLAGAASRFAEIQGGAWTEDEARLALRYGIRMEELVIHQHWPWKRKLSVARGGKP